MREQTQKSVELYNLMIKKGYPKAFCEEIARNMNTDYTAGRMYGYIRNYDLLPLEEVADEMLAILSDRDSFSKKKQLEEINAKWNEWLNR